MVSMSPSVDLRGTVSFSCMKFLTGGEFAKSIYNGPGIVELAPPFLGDIMAIRVHPNIGKGKWKTGTDAFLAATVGIENDYKSQTITQAMFSGEGLFVYTFWGDGWLFLQSFGAIARKDVRLSSLPWFLVLFLGLPCSTANKTKQNSSCLARNTTSIITTSWPGTATIRSVVWRLGVSSRASVRAKDWRASSRGQGRSCIRLVSSRCLLSS